MIGVTALFSEHSAYSQQGAYFSNANTPCAVCGPARASMLTGHGNSVFGPGGRFQKGKTTVRMLDPGYRCVELPVSDIHTGTYILKVCLNGRLHSELILVTD
jgi:hypothetical protein